jgi:hypothetical protein
MPDTQTNQLQQIKQNIEHHHKKVVQDFNKKHSQSIEQAKKRSMALAAASIMTLAPFDPQAVSAHIKSISTTHQNNKLDANLQAFLSQLNDILASKDTLNTGEEIVIAQALSKKFNVDLKVNLEGNRLNEIVGYMGKEQHLIRWAGDTLDQHEQNLAEGMAPNQGSFKDFDNAEQEKYYVAVQLHELPNWNSSWSTLKPWYRYRKVFVYNPANQKGIVAVIGDSGPAKFTGKTFGGSPELMHYLEMKDGSQKGKAVILFVNDPQNQIALGPVNSADARLANLQENK